MSEDVILAVNWKARKSIDITELENKYRPKIKRIYVDALLQKEVTVYDERWCF